MLILILIEVQYLQKAVFTFEKGSNCQNHSSSSSRRLVKRSPPVNIPIPPLRRGIYTLPPPPLCPTLTLYRFLENHVIYQWQLKAW